VGQTGSLLSGAWPRCKGGQWGVGRQRGALSPTEPPETSRASLRSPPVVEYRQTVSHLNQRAYTDASLTEALVELRRSLRGEQATLVWDGLPSHRSRLMTGFARR